MSQDVLAGLARSASVAVRAGVAPVLMGARLAWHRPELNDPELPEPVRDWVASGKILLDEIFFASEIALARTIPARHLQRAAREQQDAVDFLEERGFLDDARSYHCDPEAPDRVMMDRARALGLSFQHIRFESGFEPHAEQPGRERWLKHETNHTAHAWILRHRGPERPWVICVPGYRMGTPMIDFAGFRAHWLYRELGVNVAIPVLPLHGPRRIGSRTGDGFFTGDFTKTLFAQTQAVWDARRLVAWLRARGATAIGVHGVSLGGYTAALIASLERDLACVVAGIPAIDFSRLMDSHVPELLKRAVELFGIDLARVAKLLRPVSPLEIEPMVAPEHRHLYAGVFDRLTPPDHARDLWHHWGRPRAHWFQGGHVSFMFDPALKGFVASAYQQAGLVGGSPARG